MAPDQLLLSSFLIRIGCAPLLACIVARSDKGAQLPKITGSFQNTEVSLGKRKDQE